MTPSDPLATADDQRPVFSHLIRAAAEALREHREDVNKLNVFPVPDGDTGTNMSLTMDAVVAEIDKLPREASLDEVCRAVTHGSLMGARGNSGVILSQILRGLCEVLGQATTVDPATIRTALDRSVTVAFQAVRLGRGRHEVELVYRPRGLREGVLLALAGLLGLVLAVRLRTAPPQA